MYIVVLMALVVGMIIGGIITFALTMLLKKRGKGCGEEPGAARS